MTHRVSTGMHYFTCPVLLLLDFFKLDMVETVNARDSTRKHNRRRVPKFHRRCNDYYCAWAGSLDTISGRPKWRLSSTGISARESNCVPVESRRKGFLYVPVPIFVLESFLIIRCTLSDRWSNLDEEQPMIIWTTTKADFLLWMMPKIDYVVLKTQWMVRMIVWFEHNIYRSATVRSITLRGRPKTKQDEIAHLPEVSWHPAQKIPQKNSSRLWDRVCIGRCSSVLSMFFTKCSR